ncbi:WD repeat-containing protein 97 isoform X3 [Alexandromys fortis]|uniref:WD repeat-containing protein 97 isoform X3 n=1 Tax=Alexandromys fortis TaxID=100897 RepID=UPI002153788B|nr:WD repeat-containing protein 97 isoform X3 [Microtus fortis]
MEDVTLDASNLFASEGDNAVLDTDVYDQEGYDVPDPGVLSERHELGLDEAPQALQLFTNSQRWRKMTLRSRARLLWLHLRTYLHDIVEKEKRAELRVTRMTHGLEPLRRLKVAAGLRSVAQDPVGGRFMVLDGEGYLHQHTKDGWVQAKLQAPVVLNGLVTVPGPLGEVGRFVGWGPAGLSILGPDFHLLWLSLPQENKMLGQEPLCCLPVPSLGLLLVAQVGGSLELWKFRSGGRRLVSCGSPLQPPPGLSGSLKRLALGPETDHGTQHCFAAYGSAVLTFDLDTWSLVNVCQDLHKTIISDLEYCEEVEAMVTASRDSTVKVWEADWQIRMVFVGHTGPVTAMTVLQNTSLVVSASQDGTLRTWDLRAATQVGEVTLGCWNQDILSERVSRLLAPAAPGWSVLSLFSKSVELWRVRDLYSPLAQLSAPVLHVQVAPVLPTPAEPPLPSRLVCACADGSVYLVSAATGRTVSSLLLEPEDCAAGVAYCLSREALWVLTRSGHLLRANAARCPMVVLHRLRPSPPPAPQPCCLHLYSHLTDPRSAFSCWEIVRHNQGDTLRSAIAWSWKNKNRFLPMIGHSDGTLSVLDWRTSVTVFLTEAHSPEPVTAIGSTWNSIVTSGGDLTVKMWRVFPYAEESLSLLRTFSCCHPAVMLCALGKRITVGFEDPESATYGLVQYDLGDKMRSDHRPQDDPTDHITGLCCCPTLKIYACSSLDCTIRIWTWENRLLRLLQLDGPPQALAFSNNNGDLVFALGSRLCLVSHMLYLPTSYLVEKLCQKSPEVVNDPPLPLNSQKPLTFSQLQRLASLHGAASLSVTLPFTYHQTETIQQPVLKEDLKDLIARDQDLQELRQGLVVPSPRPQLSWKMRQEAFDSYLHLIYGSDLLDIKSEREFLQWGTAGSITEKETQDMGIQPGAATSGGQATLSTDVQPVSPPSAPHTPGAPGRRFARPPRVSLPIPPTHRTVHSQASQLLARSSLSCELGLSLDLQLRWDSFGKKIMDLNTSPDYLKNRVPLLLHRRPRDPLSKLGGFFPATIQPHRKRTRPISFPGCVPNSVIVRQMWLQAEVSCLGSLEELTQDKFKSLGGKNDEWLKRRKHSGRWRKKLKLLYWLQSSCKRGEGEDYEEEDEEVETEWLSPSPTTEEHLEADTHSSMDLTTKPQPAVTQTQVAPHQHKPGRSLLEERYGHLPKFLHQFVVQNWFKKLFPIFTLEAYPEMGTIDGLASVFVDFLQQATWAERVHILNALLRLFPEMSSELHSRLQAKLLYLLNQDQPPSLQDKIQKQFVMLALQLLLACTLEVLDVVLEILTYYLYSPASFHQELMNLLVVLGLKDPQGFLFKELATWSENFNLDSKANIRTQCQQKLEEMSLQMTNLEQSAASASTEPPREVSSQASLASGALLPALSTSWLPSQASEVSLRVQELMVSPVPSVLEPVLSSMLDLRAASIKAHSRMRSTKRVFADTLRAFCSVTQDNLCVPVSPAVKKGSPPLEETEWSHSQILDLFYIDVLNFFCEKHRTRQQSLLEEEEEERLHVSGLSQLRPNIVVRPPRDRWCALLWACQVDPAWAAEEGLIESSSFFRLYPIFRLQETRQPSFGMFLRGHRLYRQGPARGDGSLRVLKLPLPRVELQPFPPGWPAPPRALPPLLLQPTLQRYFLPQDTNPNIYG